MWPWEHLAVGYLLYSSLARAWTGDPPDARAALVLAAATQLPDLIDKPLAWGVGILPAGRSLGHSLLVTAALVLVALAVWRPVAPAVAVGTGSHLAGDVFYPLATEGEAAVDFLLFPFVAVEAGGAVDAVPHFLDLVAAFLAFLATPRGALYLLFEAALLGVALAVWVADGATGVDALRRAITRVVGADRTESRP